MEVKERIQELTMLLKEAKRIINSPKRRRALSGPVWACGGALLTAIIWLFTIFL